MSQTQAVQAEGVTAPITEAMVEAYHQDGFLQLPPEFLPPGTLPRITAAVPGILAEEGPRRVLERDGVTVRSVYGPHQTNPVIAAVARLPQLLAAVTRLIGDDVYVHQSKVNLKAPFVGEQWEWHQDYINWLRIDGIRRPDLINVAVFLDEVTEFNGPLTFIRGSHRDGLLPGSDAEGMPAGYEDAPDWVATLTSSEKFQIGHDTIERLARSNGMASPKGAAGSVLLFHANVLHASAPNISPFGRSVLILVYNGVSNAAPQVPNPRPAFLAERDFTPLRPLG
jgi:ectoine hydroxylase